MHISLNRACPRVTSPQTMPMAYGAAPAVLPGMPTYAGAMPVHPMFAQSPAMGMAPAMQPAALGTNPNQTGGINLVVNTNANANSNSDSKGTGGGAGGEARPAPRPCPKCRLGYITRGQARFREMPANDSGEMLPYEPSNLIVSVVFSCYLFYTAAIVIGIPCNVFVLYRMIRLSRRCAEVYSNGVGLCLFVMAVADIGSLCSILVHYVLSIFTATEVVADYIGVEGLDIVCKLATLSMHISTFVSIWSWLLMSTLRYLSVYQPLLYIRLWKFPTKAMFTVISAAVVCNAWLLISVESNPSGGCTMVSLFGYQQINKAFLLIESTLSFIIPTLTIVYMDASVLLGLRFKKMTTKAERPDLRRNFSPNPNRNSGYLWRWLVIALIDVGLNAPENLSRLGLILGIIEYSDNELFYIYRIMAQVPYYLQFGFNGFYLALFIYDKSTRPQRRRLIESFSAEHHNTERPREALGSLCRRPPHGNEFHFSELHPVECNSLCDSGIEDEPCRV